MKHWYILTVWFDNKACAMELVRAVDDKKALEAAPYGWRDFVEPRGQGVVKLTAVIIDEDMREIGFDAIDIPESAS